MNKFKLEPELEGLARQLEGSVYTEGLNERFYRLSVYTQVLDGLAEWRYYSIPDLKSGLILMDALCAEYRQLLGSSAFVLINVEQWIEAEGEWEIWEDGLGNSIKDFEIDENFILIPPFEW